MLAAGLVAKKAVEKGLTVPPYVKTSLAPGSRVVTDYLLKPVFRTYLDQIGFNLVGYGCTTCIGNSGPLAAPIEAAIQQGDLVAASVLSGNRNFEARVHSSIKANFLMSPPLVVAFALAGRVDIDLTADPIGKGSDGNDVYLRDIWPTNEEILDQVNPRTEARDVPEAVRGCGHRQSGVERDRGGHRRALPMGREEHLYPGASVLRGFSLEVGTIQPIGEMRPLAILGDSVTTDHISPAGSFRRDSPAGRYLVAKGVAQRIQLLWIATRQRPGDEARAPLRMSGSRTRWPEARKGAIPA